MIQRAPVMMIEGLNLTIRNARTRAGVLATALALVLSGCAGEQVSENAAYNSSDIAFVEAMIPHHEQAIEMAALAAERSSDTEILTLASDIQFMQAIEVEQMQGFLLEWNLSADSESHDGHGEGMIADEELTQLAAAAGADFDLLFAQLMLRHHEGAVREANKAISEGKFPEVKELAQSIVDSQTLEIEQLNQIISRLSPAE